MTPRICLFAFAFSATAHATDVAFWKPYETDPQTLVLENFDSMADAPDGKFGQAYAGPNARSLPPVSLDKPGLSLEAWVKLDQLPSARAYVIRRPAEPGKTQGAELFIEPDGRLGIAATNVSGVRAELTSESPVVESGRWIHLAGVTLNRRFNVLYVDGREVARVTLAQGREGLGSDKKTEIQPIGFSIGEGISGLLDEVRAHTNVNKFWPRPEQPWVASNQDQPLPPLMPGVVSEGRAAPVRIALDGTTDAEGDASVSIKPVGDFVDGLRGKAWRGTLDISGQLAGADAGTIEFWSRPVGVNNFSDQNLPLFNTNLFNFYLFNTNRHEYRAMTVTYRTPEDKTEFLYDALRTEIFPDAWNHYVITWGGGKMQWYGNGQLAAEGAANFRDKDLRTLRFNPGRRGEAALFGDIDEVFIYRDHLAQTEAANLFWRYRDSTKIVKPEPPAKADLKFWFLPTSGTLYIKTVLLDPSVATTPPTLHLASTDGKEIFSAEAKWENGDDGFQEFQLPDLDNGNYSLRITFPGGQSPEHKLNRERFAWEGNSLGITSEVFAPFTPVEVHERTVSVVLREHTMNAFGLWDSVQSMGRELLAEPMRLVAVGKDGKELPWTKGEIKNISAAGDRAVFESTIENAAMRIVSTSEIEVDGMMRVTSRIEPVKNPVPIQRLTLQIPLKRDEVSLFHEAHEFARDNFADAVPPGKGEVWNSLKTVRRQEWLNAFTSYLWLGGPRRGVAWFAENDKGWITAKNFERGLQRIVQSDGQTVMEIDFVNLPTTVLEPTEWTFGLQASPTRPQPADYRNKALTLPHVGLPVHPWGGLSCSWKSPWMDQWEVVDKVIEGRNEGKVDEEWFKTFRDKTNPPPVHGVTDWVADVTRFARGTLPLDRPDPVYFEEMYSLPFTPEFRVFQDEWSLERLPGRVQASTEAYRNTGGSSINPREPVNFIQSYQDYGMAYAEQWIKRGVSIYWDNTQPKTSLNPWTSAAYVAEDGRIQPGLTLWNIRNYAKRTWNLTQQWVKRGVPRPMEFVVHMTNNNMLPLFSWSTANYDIEMDQAVFARNFPELYNVGKPYTPNFLLAESTGLHVGAYPYLVHTVFKNQSKLDAEALGIAPEDTETSRREWGMRMVHEIIRGGPSIRNRFVSAGLDKALYAWGYGGPDVKVWNYWDDVPAFRINNPDVKGILLTKASNQTALFIAQSWARGPADFQIAFDAKVIGFEPKGSVISAFSNQTSSLSGGSLALAFDFPYETGVFEIGGAPRQENIIFEDAFTNGPGWGWDFLSLGVPYKGPGVKLSSNDPASEPIRLIKWLALPEFSIGSLSLDVQIEKIPSTASGILEIVFPGTGVETSERGTAFTKLKKDGLVLRLSADAASGWKFELLNQNKPIGSGIAGPVGTAPHTLKITLGNDGTYQATWDGRVALEIKGLPLTSSDSFAMEVPPTVATTVGSVLLRNLRVVADAPDWKPLESRISAARARSQEIVAKDTDLLRTKLKSIFPTDRATELYQLGLFRSPEADVQKLIEHMNADPSHLSVYLEILTQLPAAQNLHVEAQKKIGQDAERLPAFQSASKLAVAHLHGLLKQADASGKAEIKKTIAAFENE